MAQTRSAAPVTVAVVPIEAWFGCPTTYEQKSSCWPHARLGGRFADEVVHHAVQDAQQQLNERWQRQWEAEEAERRRNHF
jgi:hypothetical protein